MNVEILKNKLITRIKKENEYGKLYIVSLKKLYKSRISIRHFFTPSRALIAFVFIVGSLQMLKDSHGSNGIILLMFCILIILSLYMKHRFFPKYRPFEPTLRNFIYQNNLYEAKNGQLVSEIRMAYIEDLDVLRVIIEKNGDRYQKIANELGESLESKLGMPLYTLNATIDFVEYVFRKSPAERNVIKALPLEDEDMSLQIFDNNRIILRNNFSTIISGVSGSGKSTLLYGLIGQFVSKTVKGKHARLYVHDSKMSDIYKHMVLADMPENQFGTTVKDAFSMLNELLEELERRKEIYTNSSEFDTVAMDLDLTSDVLEPILFVIDEYPSLLGLMDSKQRTDWNKKLGNYLRLSRQLSMGAWLVLQQANADETTGISTGLREQLVNKIYTGSEITAQSAQMMFSRGIKELPKVMDKYGGLLSIDSKEPVAFLSPSFAGDINEILHPVLVNASNNYKKFIKEC